MVSYRLIIAVIVGIAFSFFTAFIFNIEEILIQIQIYWGTDILKVLILLLEANFGFDIISFFMGTPTLPGFFAPQIFATLILGFICGVIAKGLKRGFFASVLAIIVSFLIWMLLSVISGEDLMSFFQGAQLISTIGGILSALLGASIGGILGGLISGAYEESY